jgi:hypothetical protein
MLYEALLLSVVILVVLNLGYISRRMAPWVAIGCAAFFILVPIFFWHPFSPSVLLRPRAVTFVQTVFLVFLTFQGLKRGWKARSFLMLSVATTAVVYAVLMIEPITTHSELARLRSQYPLESMEERLPRPQTSNGDKELPPATLKHLEQQEDEFRVPHQFGYRGVLLRNLHQEHWNEFANSPMFGELRRFRPTEKGLRIEPLPEEPVPQPGPSFPSPFSPADSGKRPDGVDHLSLFDLHRTGFFDFFSPGNFGYFRDRSAVAGFQPHCLRSVPSQEGWKVRRVDLVGLLLREEPVVYLTDGLPRMDQASRAPTRPLDAFESVGLKELHKGEDLFVREVPQGLRMLGALRSIKWCVECHGCQRGDLLGAFSYSLQRQD